MLRRQLCTSRTRARLLASLLACSRAWVRAASLRRSDVAEIVGVETLMLEHQGPRTCVRAEFCMTGASTPGGHFIVKLWHTRSGSVKSGYQTSAENPLQFKQDRRGSEI